MCSMVAQSAQNKDVVQRDAILTGIRVHGGPDLLDALSAKGTIEIMLNPDGRLWIEKLGEDIKPLCDSKGHEMTMRRDQAEGMINVIASSLGTICNAQHPIMDKAEFPFDGSRFSCALPPVVKAPAFCIRKRPDRVYTLEEYVESGIMTKKQHDVICQSVADHKNMVIIGGTSSGKTTLTNAIINEVVRQYPLERIFVFEDTSEIQCDHPNALFYRTAENVDMSYLLRLALRMRPDRICVGEVRDYAALDLMDAWNTGHDGGVCTIHANDARRGLTRIEGLISRHQHKPACIQDVVGESVHNVIFIRKTEDKGRRVEMIIEVNGYDHSKNDYNFRQIG
ncbi:MAG: P-type conjugative transfer ATPase TrbB [Lachnospiraceae bacterium]|nr:P-type conjugative transfer ATPase TrbB [Lachnospiraceae bacterium]